MNTLMLTACNIRHTVTRPLPFAFHANHAYGHNRGRVCKRTLEAQRYYPDAYRTGGGRTDRQTDRVMNTLTHSTTYQPTGRTKTHGNAKFLQHGRGGFEYRVGDGEHHAYERFGLHWVRAYDRYVYGVSRQ